MLATAISQLQMESRVMDWEAEKRGREAVSMIKDRVDQGSLFPSLVDS